MIKKLMMLCVAAMAAMGAWATGEKSVVLGDWYEAHLDNVATTCARWDDFWMGANVAIPVTGLASPISASDVVVTEGTYSEFGKPYVLTEAEMWNRYGAPVLREKNLGNVKFDRDDNVWQNWDAEEYGAYGYELSADIWPDWSQVSGRQWILIPTGVPRSGRHTFSVKINGVEHSNYVVSFVLTEDQEPVPYGYQVTFNPNGGEVEEDNREVAAGKSIGTLPTPTRSKYKFLGWYTAPEGGTKISATTKVTGDVTYYAQWVYDGSATISVVVADGCEAMGKVTGGKTAKAGTKLTLKATANKGFVFAGWWDVNADDWFYGPEDYRNPNLSYVMTDSDVELMAVFMPAADDWVEVWLDRAEEYTTGEEISDIYVEVDSGSLATLKFKGLPSGLKYTAKAIYDRDGELLHEANTIYGTPTKSGVYTVEATVTTAGKKTAICSQTIIVRKAGEMVVVAECDANGGKVTGGGVYAEGKKVALKAMANKGFVFAGWYEDESFATPCDSSLVDYRTASYAYTMGTADKTFYARFIPAVEDSLLDLTVNGKTVPTTFTISKYAQLKLDVDSLSLPKISVKNLPAGMKFTATPIYKKGSKTEIEVPANTIYGAPTKPERKTVTVSISNQSIKKAIVKDFSIEVPNLTGANDCFVEALDNGVGKKRVLSVGITNIDDFLPSLKVKSNTAKLAVSGLPAGLKYDAKTGKITGVATKPGVYTVTLTVTDGKAKYVSTITIEVEALPDWVVGTFRGGVESFGDDWSDALSFEVKVTPQGRVSAKLIEPVSAWGDVSLKTAGFRKNNKGDYVFVIYVGDFENGEEGSIGEVRIFESVNGMGYLYAEEDGRDEDNDEFEVYWSGYQNVYSLTSSDIPKPVFKTDNKLYSDSGIDITFGANGLVTVSDSDPGVLWGKSQLLPIEYDADNGIVTASLWLMGYNEWEDFTFGAELILTVPVSPNGAAKASKISIKEVIAGPNWE